MLRRKIRTGGLRHGTRADDEEIVLADRHAVARETDGPGARGTYLEFCEQR